MALAAQSEFEPALDHLLVVVRSKGPRKEEARLAIVDIFGVLGNEHPLTQTYGGSWRPRCSETSRSVEH